MLPSPPERSWREFKPERLSKSHRGPSPGLLGAWPALHPRQQPTIIPVSTDSGTVRAVGLNNAASWKSVNALAVNGNDFYVLDNEAGQIWHYTLNGGAFTDPPSPLLVKADLPRRIWTFSDDCHLCRHRSATGGLFRVRDGRLEEVKIDGIDHRLVSPQPPVYDASTGLQYIADVGNQRVVASQGADVYAFQYSGAVLQGLRAIALDPSAGLLYALSVQKLYAIPLR